MNAEQLVRVLLDGVGMPADAADHLGILGQRVSIHPAIRMGDEHESFMKWSVKVNSPTPQMIKAHKSGTIPFPNIAGDFACVLLKDVFLQINHNLVDKSVRNPKLGKKAPIILAQGTLVAYDDVIHAPKGSGWKSITYNPHKHPEYVENPKGMPTDWWHDYEKFPGFHPSASRVSGGVEQRIKNMQAVATHPQQPLAVTKKNSQGFSNATASEALFHQHNFTPREYMWVKNLKIVP